MRLEHLGLATDEHGDVTVGRLVHTTGHRRLEHVDALRFGERAETLSLALVVRAHVDPRAARTATSERLDHAARSSDDRVDRAWRRQTGEHRVGGIAHALDRRGGLRALGDESFDRLRVEVVHGDLESVAHEAACQVLADVSESDESATHVFPQMSCGCNRVRAESRWSSGWCTPRSSATSGRDPCPTA